MGCPNWLIEKIDSSGGFLSFHDFMASCLNDKRHGAYSTGKLRIGKKGDFVTSPSLSPDFSDLLAVQIINWLSQINTRIPHSSILSIVELGPGEGHLMANLINRIEKDNPTFLDRIQFILIEPNRRMRQHQKRRLASFSNVSIFWKSIDDLILCQVDGVIIANEMFDALPVERLVWSNDTLWRQGVSLKTERSERNLTLINLALSNSLSTSLISAKASLGIEIPPPSCPNGWNTEWHINLSPWFQSLKKVLNSGVLLVIDYCLNSSNYYNSSRIDGTLLAYKNQKAITDFLSSPGDNDLTSHLCIETLNYFAESNGWKPTGCVKQGEALLSLGLAEKLSQLREYNLVDLDKALARREALLRLVDPYLLGGFYWLSYEPITNSSIEYENIYLKTPI